MQAGLENSHLFQPIKSIVWGIRSRPVKLTRNLTELLLDITDSLVVLRD
jgi:hypothetical protein